MAPKGTFGAAGVYWGTIQAAVNARLTTQELYSALYNAALETTGQVPRFGFQEVTALRSVAVRNREAVRQLANADPASALGPEHIGSIPHSAPYGGPTSSRRYNAVIEHIVDRRGSRIVETRTVVLSGGHPPTKRALINELNRAASRLADDYEDEVHVGIGAISLLAA